MTNPAAGPTAGTTTTPELFVVSTHKVRGDPSSEPGTWVPYGTQHAWRPGTRRALCGEFTGGWTVFWERRFTARAQAACPGCVEMTLPEASRRRLDPIERRAAS